MMNFEEKRFASILTQNWTVLLARGIITMAFGIIAWLEPQISLGILTLLFGAFTLVDGILGIWIAYSGHKAHHDWRVLLIWGCISFGFGAVTFLSPDISALALLFIIAIWAIITGIIQLIAANRLRKDIRFAWLLKLGGVASVVFGLILMLWPGFAVLAMLWLISAYTIVLGFILTILAFKVRTFETDLEVFYKT